jgi:hypothetical protein
MKSLHTRNDLLDLASRHAPTKACERIIKERGAIILGGFILAGGLPGWIVQVQSDCRTWNIAIICHEHARKYSIDYLDDVPWESWTGRINGQRPLVDGDIPTSAALYRLRARNQEKCPRKK